MLASLPDNPIYCFAPMNDADGEPPQIRILVEGLAFTIPTALVALNHAGGITGAILRRRDPTDRALPVEHYSAAVNRYGRESGM